MCRQALINCGLSRGTAGTSGLSISVGEKNRSFRLLRDDIGQEIFVVVTADDGNHTGTVTSAPVTVAGSDAGTDTGTALTLLVRKVGTRGES